MTLGTCLWGWNKTRNSLVRSNGVKPMQVFGTRSSPAVPARHGGRRRPGREPPSDDASTSTLVTWDAPPAAGRKRSRAEYDADIPRTPTPTQCVRGTYDDLNVRLVSIRKHAAGDAECIAHAFNYFLKEDRKKYTAVDVYETYGQLFGSLAVNMLILFPSSHKCQPTSAGLQLRGRRAPRVGFTLWAYVDRLAVYNKPKTNQSLTCTFDHKPTGSSTKTEYGEYTDPHSAVMRVTKPQDVSIPSAVREGRDLGCKCRHRHYPNCVTSNLTFRVACTKACDHVHVFALPKGCVRAVWS
ncbi:hypothetical protein GGX14DRAFT_660764 [Mycena pura]|uniref:Uncharacterized protein n=1 Tax=Mycena pura TaxID=153505 RepID=A0AAD6V1T6_9AGAR|nr:hypothetical protein GGX14DRAFT_660764 [Mycena pura]